jgi:hypothetical protein
MNRNNYRLFHDRSSDRMVFMPHGLDQMFDYPPGRFPTDASLQPPFRGRIARAVLGTREGNRLYFERIAELQKTIFKEETIVARVQELAKTIRPTLVAYSPSAAEWHDQSVVSLCERIGQRVRSVAEQLELPREPLLFDAEGIAIIPAWNDRMVSQGSAFTMDTVETDGRTCLRIAARNRGGTGSWRTRVRLESGRYRFEGRVRGDSRATGTRVRLRISGGRPESHSLSGSEWVSLSYPFSVEEMLAEVVLVCEFVGNRGEALFDLDSLRLVRE